MVFGKCIDGVRSIRYRHQLNLRGVRRDLHLGGQRSARCKCPTAGAGNSANPRWLILTLAPGRRLRRGHDRTAVLAGA
jgi:hypothetical protein